LLEVKLFSPSLTQKEEWAVVNVLRGNWSNGAGTGLVKEFEDKFTEYINADDTVAVNSGTAALHLALSLYSLKGKEVILPSLTFASTANAILYNGGIPKFVDVDEKTLCIDPALVQEATTEATACIMPVHFGGLPCVLDKIKAQSIPLVQDAAHAAGAVYRNNMIGSHETCCFSFHAVKNLAMPAGGAITLNGENVAENKKRLNARRWCGITDRKGTKYDIKENGFNYYMSEFSAKIGMIQLEKLDQMNKRRYEIAKRYTSGLSDFHTMPLSTDCSYHLFWIRVAIPFEFMRKMKAKGVETGVHYNPLHKMTLYDKGQALPVTEKVCKEIVSIPMHADLTDDQVDWVIKSANS